jgi:hypothetical protein
MISAVLELLTGEPLSSVVFVMDYLQLDFNGTRLTCFVWPTVELEGEDPRTFGDPGYRDALCVLITQEVSGSEESAVAGLILSFATGSLRLKPAAEDLVGPEIAMLQMHGEDRQWEVWRPGELPFENLDE